MHGDTLVHVPEFLLIHLCLELSTQQANTFVSNLAIYAVGVNRKTRLILRNTKYVQIRDAATTAQRAYSVTELCKPMPTLARTPHFQCAITLPWWGWETSQAVVIALLAI